MNAETPLAAHLAGLTASPFVPELHTDDCDDTSCVRCRVLTPSNLYEVDTWLDNAGVFTKQFWRTTTTNSSSPACGSARARVESSRSSATRSSATTGASTRFAPLGIRRAS